MTLASMLPTGTLRPSVFKHVEYGCGHYRLETKPGSTRKMRSVCPACEQKAKDMGIRLVWK